ncbi:MAG: cytidine deaminase [Pseudomonadota bacterium]
MSQNPFASNAQRAALYTHLEETKGNAIRAEASRCLDRTTHTLSKKNITDICDTFGLPDDEALLVLLPPLAADLLSNPTISDFFVGAVGRDRESGDFVLGANAEVFGAHLGYTLHGEGFVAIRAYHLGMALDRIAIGEAHPCGHCRQFLSEFAFARELRLVDPLGYSLTLGELFPWPFDPAYLGETGAIGGTLYWPDLKWSDSAGSSALLEAGKRSYAPYSKAPSAVALCFDDGVELVAGTIESVAFNPTISPAQAGIVACLAAGRRLQDIRTVTLGTIAEGAVQYDQSTRHVFATAAPEAKIDLAEWRAS